MRRSGDFATAIRTGRRAGSRRLVVHVATTDQQEPTRIGLVVSKQVGNSVVRHRVARQLRAIAAERLSHWPAGRLMVIRALPAAHGSPSSTLGSDFDQALRRLAVEQ
jgi:ribonuclease P protein component